MFRSEDYLRGEISKIENGEPLIENIDDFANDINIFLKKISGDSGQDSAAGEEAPAADSVSRDVSLPDDPGAECFLHMFLDNGVGMENLRAYMVANAVRECGIDFRYYPQDMESNSATSQEIIENGFFFAFDSQDAASQAVDILKSQNHISSYELVTPEVPEPPKEAPASASAPAAGPAAPVSQAPAAGQNAAPAKPAAQAKTSAPVKQSLISVNLSKLDALMAIVGEIVITESMVTASPELQLLPRDSYDNFMKSGRQLRKLTDDLQDIAMSLRMVPISGVFQKMNRIVRDMKQSLNKDVRLTIIGEDTEVDKNIVDSIQDPIMHLVRNSMDHGIEETAQERIDAGKDPQGELILSASHTSSEVIISISDDGYGMDPDKLLAKAREKGLLVKPESEYTQKEALSLIMLPGFSTNQAVTEYSGRGVGMDVVKRNVESIGGMVSINSELGVGTTMTLKIPLTLAIVDGMKVTVGSSIFTIPIANIRQSFKVTPEQIIRDENGNEMMECLDNFYPIIRLHEFYHLDTEVLSMEEGIVMWVEASDRSYCLFVDDLIGEQQVVVKPLPVFLNPFNLKNYGISGCTILGDGNISIILDVLSLHTAAIENV
jgi:two-component system chemotaxis sensor kinase CheA